MAQSRFFISDAELVLERQLRRGAGQAWGHAPLARSCPRKLDLNDYRFPPTGTSSATHLRANRSSLISAEQPASRRLPQKGRDQFGWLPSNEYSMDQR